MQFIAQRNDLLSALTITGKAITKSVIPILDNYRFYIAGGMCIITGSNLEVFVTKSIDIKSDIDSLDICIGSKELLPLIKGLPDQPLTFNIDGLRVSVTAATGKYDLPAESGADYPTTPEVDGHTIDISTDSLIDGIEKTLFSINPNINKTGFNYALFDFGNGIKLVGCNTRVMSINRIHENTINRHQALITKSSLEILRSISSKGEIGISYSDNNMLFSLSDSTMMTTQVIDEKYPDYTSIIPAANDKSMIVDSDELLSAIRRVSLFGFHGVLFDFKSGKLEIKADNVDLEKSASEEVHCDYTGDDFKITLMADQLVEILLKIKGGSAYFSFSDKNKPALVRSDLGTEDFDLFLTMPLYMKD
jgi:DNA polymerase-3 subunit beta